jgi:CheY-specific phosphatase CheX
MSPAGSKPDLDRIGGEALRAVLGALLGIPATEVKPVDEAASDAPGPGLLATVQLTGPRVSGVVHLRIPHGFAEEAVFRLHGNKPLPLVSRAEVEDFTGELCNMLAGRVAAGLRLEGYACGLGTPEVVDQSGVGRTCRSAPDLPAGAPAGAPAGGFGATRLDWTCQGHRLTLEMQIRYQPT